MRVGDTVRINTPENLRLHGTEATVVQLEEWGAHLHAPAAATKGFRAAWGEMTPAAPTVQRPYSEATGDACDKCGSTRMRWAGACKVCEDCGTSGGCG